MSRTERGHGAEPWRFGSTPPNQNANVRWRRAVGAFVSFGAVRRLYLVLILIGIVLFLAITAVLARVWNSAGAETAALTSLVKAEAQGNQADAVAEILGCRSDPSCRERVAQNIAALARPGSVSIIQINPSTGFSLTSTLGVARVAWTVGSSLPIVQCVRVRHAGDALHGLHVELLEVSLRIKSDADCPSRF